MKKNYHVREWLNPKGLYATSTITAFCGMHSFHNDKSETVEFKDKQLHISDCERSIRIHQAANMSDEEYIKKIRIIERVCKEFADHLETLGVEDDNNI